MKTHYNNNKIIIIILIIITIMIIIIILITIIIIIIIIIIITACLQFMQKRIHTYTHTHKFSIQKTQINDFRKTINK